MRIHFDDIDIASRRTVPQTLPVHISSLPFRVALPTLLLALAACTDATYGVPDLPETWADAQHIARFTQGPCNCAAPGGPPETIEASANDGSIDVSYAHAAFRCQQDVEGYVRQDGEAIDVLVQPINLNPVFLSKCDCQYDVAMTIPAAKRGRYPAGAYRLSVYRRWDNVNEPNDPLEIGSAMVEVP
jgi:hypothetical protein